MKTPKAEMASRPFMALGGTRYRTWERERPLRSLGPD